MEGLFFAIGFLLGGVVGVLIMCLSREAYLRHLVNGLVPQDAPPPAYYDFMRELHRIGGNLNQIAQKAHVLGVIDERRYDEEVKKFDRLVREITKAVILPRPME